MWLGIDSGIRTTKAVVLRDGKLCARAKVATDWEPEEAAHAARREVLAQVGIAEDELAGEAVTGIGKEKVSIERKLSGINAAALGARAYDPTCRAVIDLGAEGIRAIGIDEAGTPGNFAVNDKCASGAGAFLETMARILDEPVGELGTLGSQRTEDVSVDTQCVVFAESEVISLIHRQVPAPSIIHAIHKGLANKVGTIALRAGVGEPLLMIGASAANADLVACLEEKLGAAIQVPEDHEFVSAWGAALAAQQGRR